MTRKIFFILFAFYAFSGVGLCQSNSLLDSLQSELSHVKNDSVRIQILLQLSRYLVYQNVVQAEEYSKEAEVLSNKKNWIWAKALAAANKGTLADFQGDYFTSLEYNNRALQLDLMGNDTLSICTDYINVGNAYMLLGKFDEAYFHNTKAFEASQQIHDTLTMAIALHNLAVIYSSLGRLDVALQHFKISSQYSEQVHDTEGPVYNHHEMGRAYLLVGDHNKAKSHLEQAIVSSKKLAVSVVIPKAYKSMAELLYKTKKYENQSI